MKKFICGLMAALMATSMLNCNFAEAKNYYSKEFNEWETQREVAIRESSSPEIGHVSIIEDENSASMSADYNGDGKIENVRITRMRNNDYTKATITVTVNGKEAVKLNLGNKLSTMYVQFNSVKLGSSMLGILQYGDNDYAAGGINVYKWSKNSLKLLKTYNSEGYLWSFVSSDPGKKGKYLYLADSKQFYNSSKNAWPKAIRKKYAKWKNDSVSVTKTEFTKFVLKKGKLKKAGKDTYYKIGTPYD